MVREVPELMERTPQEARQRWLRLTGRLGGGSNGESGRVGEGGDKVPGSPALDTFYVQVIYTHGRAGGADTVFSALFVSDQLGRQRRDDAGYTDCFVDEATSCY